MVTTDATQFTFDDFLALYLEWPAAGQPYEEISAILEEAKRRHAAAWFARTGGDGDHLQSWKAWKGNNFERLVREIVTDEVNRLNRQNQWSLRVTSQSTLKRVSLPSDLARVKRNLVVDFGDHGMHLPDADVVVYQQHTCRVLCVLSCKVSLRDRVAQSAYWKLKLTDSPITADVAVSYVTPDEDCDLRQSDGPKSMTKNYAVVSTDIDATYLLVSDFDHTDRIKPFSSFENDLRSWLGGGGRWLRTCPDKLSSLRSSISERSMLGRRFALIAAVPTCSAIHPLHSTTRTASFEQSVEECRRCNAN